MCLRLPSHTAKSPYSCGMVASVSILTPMQRQCRIWMQLLGAAWLLATVQPMLPLDGVGLHAHSVSHFWSHGHLHKVLSHHDEPRANRNAPHVAYGDIHSDADHHHADEHVTHDVSIDTPVGVSTQMAGASVSLVGGRLSICDPPQPTVQPHSTRPLRPPTPVSLRTTVLLI